MRLLRKPTTQPELDDDHLVERCRDGHPEAFGTLYDRHLPGLYAYAYRLLGNQTDAIAGYCGESDFTPSSCLFNGAQNSLICRQ